MKILVTGFEPFGGSDVNSSWETAVLVGQQSFSDVEVVVRQLPVCFGRVGDEIVGLLEELRPDALVMLGQRGKGVSVDVERIAVNLMDSAKPDNGGCHPQEEPIVSGGVPAYFSNLPVKGLRDSVLAAGVPSKVSNSAGLYVCNCAYYSALSAIQRLNSQIKCVFLHLPKISEEFPVDRLALSVGGVIEEIIKI